MRQPRALTFGPALLLLTSQALAQAAPRWLQIAPHREGFTVQMPAAPTRHEPVSDGGSVFLKPGGTEIRRHFVYDAYYDGAVYLVHVYEASSSDQLRKELTDERRFKGVLVRESKAEGMSEREYETRYTGFYSKTRFITLGKLLYEVEGAARAESNPTLVRFLSSFKLGKANPSKGAEITPVADGELKARADAPASTAGAGGAPEGAGVILAAKDVTLKAVLVFRPEPPYTEEARKNQVRGTVRVRFVVSASGGVTNVTVVRGLKYGLNEMAVAAARAIRFLPAEKDGRRVSQWVTVDYNFNIY